MSVTDKGGDMANRDGDVRDRLQQAALGLFQEHGYDRTTAAEIAARAGVTERTFFRHFPDKREVLFDGEAILREALLAAIGDIPDDVGPLDTLFRAFGSIQPLLENNRSFAKPRQALIAGTPALQERELAKLAVLADALAEALVARDVPEVRAILAARTGMAAFAQAVMSWLDDEEGGLGARLDLTERELNAIVTHC
ncbi:TetR/AcrR family transcriptional regulator [Sphingomonas sp. EC-HK361]|uniref:TetR/AcrR family transcriptional regulator n=1 Tax=Sphingomonas sp. EC-HK361 TaxID=2038397 RepID=UPI001F48C75C|nr:TetR/AcrR family transcriptional regulator [Sphingomonas sp. EC-HK361]